MEYTLHGCVVVLRVRSEDPDQRGQNSVDKKKKKTVFTQILKCFYEILNVLSKLSVY